MLILNGHKSYRSAKFNRACIKKNIVPIYLLLHASHLLQPLNVGCFRPLKNAYRREIAGLAKLYIYYITKETFIQAFKVAYNKLIIKKNILASFKSASIILLNLDVVLLRINIKQKTPLPPTVEPNL